MTVVISVGGSIISPGSDVDMGTLKNMAEILQKHSENEKTVVVVGGGSLARKYIATGREIGASEYVLDEIGILSTRILATLFLASVKAYPVVLTAVDDVRRALQTSELVVMGGTTPGHTTDAVALLVAEAVGADRVLNLTAVSGIYTSDPKKDAGAELYREISYRELGEILLKGMLSAGPNVPFDIHALKIAERSGIRVYFVNGKDTEAVMLALSGENTGTVLGP